MAAGASAPRRSRVPLLALALLACAGLCSLLPRAAAVSPDRTGAFIGYAEQQRQATQAGYGACSDKLPSCEREAALNLCLTDPYRMRRQCPVSCMVEPCVSSGTVLDSFVFKGHATEAGTGAYAKALAATVGANHFNRVLYGLQDQEGPGKQGSNASEPLYLYLSSLGLGSYLGAADDATDERLLSALLYSVSRGWNVIDTAANYRDGRAEAAIGRALSLLLMGSKSADFPEARVEVGRDALFISSKAGYLTQDLKRLLLARRLVNASDIYSGVHCLAPACLRASAAASLAKLRLAQLDLLYLHNVAEVQLAARGREAFMATLRTAFKELEALRAEGKIRGYGLATWDCFRSPPGSPQHLTLEEVVNLAREVGGPHHGFLAVQAPINLKMGEAYTQKWQLVVNKTATDEAAARAAAEEAAATGQPAAQQQQQAAKEAQQQAAAPPPPARVVVVHDKVSLVDAAVRLGVQLFASAPLMEAQLLQGMVGSLDGIMEYEDIRTTAGKLLQYVRSMPGVTTAIVGQKAKEHVEGNVALAAAPQLTQKLWEVVHQQLAQAATTPAAVA